MSVLVCVRSLRMLTLGEVSRSVYTIQYEESGKDERRNNKKEKERKKKKIYRKRT